MWSFVLRNSEMEILYNFTLKINSLYLLDKLDDKFSEDEIRNINSLLSKIYNKYKDVF